MPEMKQIDTDLLIRLLLHRQRRQKRLLRLYFISIVFFVVIAVIIISKSRELNILKIIFAIVGSVLSLIPSLFTFYKSRVEADQIHTILTDINKSNLDKAEVDLLVKDLIKKINA